METNTKPDARQIDKTLRSCDGIVSELTTAVDSLFPSLHPSSKSALVTAYVNAYLFTEESEWASERVLDVMDGSETGDLEIIVDLTEYQAWNEPDRPGENGYFGVDVDAAVEGVGQAWRERAYELVLQAISYQATDLLAKAS